MGAQRQEKLNLLTKRLPEGLPVDAAWLRSEGYPPNLLRQYEAAGWLTQPAHRIYVRPRGPIEWRNGSRRSVSRGEGPLAPPGALSAHS